MIKLLIFGTGSSSEKVLININEEKATVVGFLDNNKKKQGCQYNGKLIFSPEMCKEIEYDYVLIASVKYEVITLQLLEMGVESNCIIPYFEFDHTRYHVYRKFLYIDGVNYDEIQMQLESMRKYEYNLEYEIAGKMSSGKIQIPRIENIDDTVDAIIDKRLSISRFGDGEFDIIDGRKEGYQDVNLQLALRLKEVLKVEISNHVIGLADIYGDLSHLEKKYADYFRDCLIKKRMMHYQYLDMERTYFNAFISRPYSEMREKTKSEYWFNKIKKIWEKRELIVVEGEATRFGVGNDLLSNAMHVHRIIAPSENAFDKYDEILNKCKNMSKNVLFLIALGPTASVLAYDLTKSGYQAIDIGHLDIEYEWYLRGVKEHKIIVPGKYTNEVAGGNVVEDIYDKTYIEQIIDRC